MNIDFLAGFLCALLWVRLLHLWNETDKSAPLSQRLSEMFGKR